jgi:ketosteroid isomerase-like protein
VSAARRSSGAFGAQHIRQLFPYFEGDAGRTLAASLSKGELRRMILALMVLVAVACQPGAGPLTGEDVAALRDLGQSYVRGFSANDAGAVAAVYAGSAVEMPPNRSARDGVDAIRAAYASSFEAGAATLEFTMTAAEIDGMNGLAFERGTWSWTGIPPGMTEPIAVTEKYLAIARRQEDGSWRYTAMIWNSDTPLRLRRNPTRTETQL